MPGLNTLDPIKAGAIRALCNLSAVNDTDWHNLTSADFYDTVSGSSCAAGLRFEWIGVQNEGSSSMFIKYRAREAADDATTNELRVGQVFTDDLGTLRDTITTIAYKKASGTDNVTIIAGFSAI
jgi:hypothetical protein